MAGPKIDELCDALKPLVPILLRQAERSGVGDTANVLVPVFCHMARVFIIVPLDERAYELNLRGIGGF